MTSRNVYLNDRELFPSLFRGLFADVDRGVSSLNSLVNSWGESGGFPIDVEETGEAYVITANLPGVKKEEVEISMENGRLTLAVAQGQESEQREGRRFLYRERSAKAHSRVLSLPHATAECQASLKDGVLTVNIRKEDEKKTRRISID